jgi:hypothetical protein
MITYLATLRYLHGLILVVMMSLVGPVYALDIIIQNNDGPGEGFNDPTPALAVGGNTGTTLGEQRLQVFQKAADIWGIALSGTVPVVVEANFDVMFCDASSAVLGGAGPINLAAEFDNAPQANTWYHISLANALEGEDIDPANGDISATFNSDLDNNNACLNGTNWYLGLDHNDGSDIDLLAVVLHEIGHGLGFSTFVDEANGTWFFGLPDAYASFIRDNSLGLQWTNMSNLQRKNSAINTGNLVWNGSQVTAAAGSLTGGKDGSGRVKLYAPNPVQQGSSISHWDTSATPSLLMEPYITGGLTSNLDLTDEQLADMGWSVPGGPVCGNGIKENGEQCDGSDLGGASCSDSGCGGGLLTCTAQCTLNDTLCTGCGGGGSCNLNTSCDAGEICSTCSDCIAGTITGARCGNGVCEAGDGENCQTCSQDCAGLQSGKPQNRFCCGAVGGSNNVGCDDQRCGGPSLCTVDPAAPGGSYCCGDGTCEGEENSLSCGLDCGSCTASETTESACDDGLDNDCDGAVDGEDPDCAVSSCIPSGREKGKRCSDGIDNDCNGMIDGADPAC